MKILYFYFSVFILLIPSLASAQLVGGGIDNDDSNVITRLSITNQPVSDIIEYEGSLVAYTDQSLFLYDVLQEEGNLLQNIGDDSGEFLSLQNNGGDPYLFLNTFNSGSFASSYAYNLAVGTLINIGAISLENAFVVADEIYLIGRDSGTLGLYYYNQNTSSATLLQSFPQGDAYQVEISSSDFFWIVLQTDTDKNELFYLDVQQEPANIQNYAEPNDISFTMINDNIYYGSQQKILKTEEENRALNEIELDSYSVAVGTDFFKLGTDHVGFYLKNAELIRDIKIIDNSDNITTYSTPATFLVSDLNSILQLSDNYAAIINGNNEVMVINSALEFVNQEGLFSFNNEPSYGAVFSQQYLSLYSSESSLGNKSDEILYYDLSNNSILADLDFNYSEVGYNFRPKLGSASGKNYSAAYSTSNGFELNFLTTESTNGIKISEEITNDSFSQQFLRDNGTNNISEEYSTYPKRLISIGNTLYYLAHLASGNFEGYYFLYKVNEKPTDVSLSSTSVSENTSSATEIATLTTTDADDGIGSSFSYSLLSGNGDDDNNLFNISEDKLTLAASAELDFETKNTLSIRVETQDPHGLKASKSLTIDVTDANDAPTDIELSSLSVVENVGSGTKVADISTIDQDEGDSFTYTLVDAASDSFAISGSELITNNVFDFDAQEEYQITLRTEDNTQATFEKTFTLTILEENEPPSDISLSSMEVAENASSEVEVGELSATDPNATDTEFTFKLTAGEGDDNNASFQIDNTASPALLKANSVFNYETVSTLNIRIEAEDQGGETFQKPFTISVKDKNDAPDSLAITLSSQEFSSKEANEKITRILIRDQELQEGLSTSYNLNDYAVALTGISDNDGGNFNISEGDNVYNLNAENAITYDTDNPSNNTFTFELQVEDANHPSGEVKSYTQEFTIELKDQNNAFPPSEIELSNKTLNENIEENDNGLVVGTLNTVDDNDEDSHTYSFVNDESNEDIDNALFEIMEGNQLAFKSAANLSYEEDSIIQVKIRSTDETDLFTDELFSIEIEEYIDQTPPSISTSLNDNQILALADTDTLSFSGSITDWELDTVTYKYGGILTAALPKEKGLKFPQASEQIKIPINSTDFDAFGLKIQIHAVDKSGNTDSSKVAYFYHELEAENIYSALPKDRIGQGRTSTDYKMFSVPYKLNNDEIRGFLEQQLGLVYSTDDFRILHWDTQEKEYTEIPTLTNFEPGKSFWFTTTKENPVINFAEGELYPYKADSAFTWQLKEGWNQIGNPYPVPLVWSNIIEGAALESSKLHLYDSVYQTSDTLDPYEGAFVLANEDTDLKAFISSNSNQRRKAEQAVFTWKVDFEIHQDELSNSGRIGMHPEASAQLDKFDVANPPHFSEYLELNFNKKERIYSNYKADVVESSPDYSWNLSINSHAQQRPATLKWDSEGILPDQLILIDLNSLARIDMATQNEYFLTSNGIPEFRIIYSQYSDKFNLGELRVGKPVPNPMEDITQIGFNLPESNEPYQVSAEIMSLDGKKIKQLKSNLSYTSGYHQLDWNGQDAKANEVASGVYLYRILINGNEAKTYTGRIVKTQ